jgi:hypothetical protein
MMEQEMIEGIVKFLNENGYYVWRQGNHGMFNLEYAVKGMLQVIQYCQASPGSQGIAEMIRQKLRRCFMRVPESVKGVADVIGWDKTSGKWIAVEVKTEQDRLRPEQDQWLRSLKEAGGSVYVVRDIEVFKKRILSNQSPSSKKEC